MPASSLERQFDFLLRTLAPDLPAPEPEYRFAPPRRFRFDRAFVAAKVAVEIEGGVWSGGRHTRGAGYTADLEKYNLATEEGWSVLRFTGSMLSANPHTCINTIRRTLERAGGA